VNRRLTIADIAAAVLRVRGRSGFLSEDKELLGQVFNECVKRGVMKNSDIDWSERVVSGVERSQGFVKSDYNGMRMFTLRENKIF